MLNILLKKIFFAHSFTLNLVVMSTCPYKIRLPSLKIMLKSKLHSQGCNKIIFLALINCKNDTVATEVSCLSSQFFSWVYFAPIMPAFCSLLFLSYYSKNFAGKIDSSLLRPWVAPSLRSCTTASGLRATINRLVHNSCDANLFSTWKQC